LKWKYYIQKFPNEKLPLSPTFKEVYGVISNSEITDYKPITFKYLQKNFDRAKIPLREELVFVKEMKSVIVDELITQGVIPASEEKEMKQKVSIGVGMTPEYLEDSVYHHQGELNLHPFYTINYNRNSLS
jgi:hypothetical protein